MKRSGKRSRSRQAPPTPDQIRHYMQKLAEQHQQDWHRELMHRAPHWVYLTALHLRLVELEHLEQAAGEFL